MFLIDIKNIIDKRVNICKIYIVILFIILFNLKIFFLFIKCYEL